MYKYTPIVLYCILIDKHCFTLFKRKYSLAGSTFCVSLCLSAQELNGISQPASLVLQPSQNCQLFLRLACCPLPSLASLTSPSLQSVRICVYLHPVILARCPDSAQRRSASLCPSRDKYIHCLLPLIFSCFLGFTSIQCSLLLHQIRLSACLHHSV